jgi:hypothetical protein
MTDENRIDPFDDLFEPFELEESPVIEDLPDTEPPPPRPSRSSVETEPIRLVDCPSCGTSNPAHNRHCEACGARLGQDPLPMAPPPMIRATPGGRALGVLAAVVLLVALGAVLFNVFRGDASEESATSTSTSTTAAPVEAVELRPTEVTASTELTNFEAENLIDNDPTTSWNDKSLRGQDAVLTFRFAQPVQISYIEIQNVENDERFARNYRIRGYAVVVDDLAIELTGRLEDTNDPQQIKIASLETTLLELQVTSTYPAQSADGQPPFNELAVQDVRFFGTTP